jgi:hypothetical protein
MFDRLSLGPKERGLGADSGEKYKDGRQKYDPPKSEAWHRQCQQLAWPCHPPEPLLLLLLQELAAYFDQKARGFLWNILVNSCLGYKSTI